MEWFFRRFSNLTSNAFGDLGRHDIRFICTSFIVLHFLVEGIQWIRHELRWEELLASFPRNKLSCERGLLAAARKRWVENKHWLLHRAMSATTHSHLGSVCELVTLSELMAERDHRSLRQRFRSVSSSPSAETNARSREKEVPSTSRTSKFPVDPSTTREILTSL